MVSAYEKVKASDNVAFYTDHEAEKFVSYSYYTIGSMKGVLDAITRQSYVKVGPWDTEYGDEPGHKEYVKNIEKSEAFLINVQDCTVNLDGERDYSYDEDFTYKGYVYSLVPMRYLKFLKPIVKVFTYELEKAGKKMNVIFLEDGAGDSLGIADRGTIAQREEWHAKYSDGKTLKFEFALESIMIKTASPFGDF